MLFEFKNLFHIFFGVFYEKRVLLIVLYEQIAYISDNFNDKATIVFIDLRYFEQIMEYTSGFVQNSLLQSSLYFV